MTLIDSEIASEMGQPSVVHPSVLIEKMCQSWFETQGECIGQLDGNVSSDTISCSAEENITMHLNEEIKINVVIGNKPKK